MNFLKKMSAGAWIACCAAVLTIVSLIVYAVNIGSEGYFQNVTVKNLVLWLVAAAVLLLAAIAFGQVNAKGAGKTGLDLVAGCCQIGAPVLLALSLINLIGSRIAGLGFIYFSNADVILEVQTPANLASASCTIANMIILGVALVVALVAAFCTIRKKVKEN